MVLNYIWIGFFIIAFAVATVKMLFLGDLEIFTTMMNGTFESAKTAFEISLGLTGVLSMWLGIMKIGERGGLINTMSRFVYPLFSRLFPDIPKGHPASGSMFMNFSANMLGLDNAATPLGLKAMKELQELNTDKTRASNPMIMFLVINTSGLTLIPISIMVYRAQLGAANPSDVFLPILIATFCSTLIGILSVCIYQRIRIWDKVILSTFGGLSILIVGLLFLVKSLPEATVSHYSSAISNFLLFSIIIGFIASGIRKKINVYDAFIEGAKEGFHTAVTVIPYLVAILVSIGVFRASGAMNFVVDSIGLLFQALGFNTEFVPALPTAFMKPLSGSGARGMMVDAMTNYGADSFVGRLSCLFQGASDTTFYILALYFGSVGVKQTRYAVGCGLLADAAGIIAAIMLCYLFFYQG
ncbi:MAG: nucleoside recognition domain-containing protein [Bacteroidales bacterium]|nr:nucleoside recognition domain-containing protein [Bacteroidales bacterium]MDD4821136.1 nucleoside recognition domain-containing protein [Bacteroidales bacterium]